MFLKKDQQRKEKDMDLKVCKIPYEEKLWKRECSCESIERELKNYTKSKAIKSKLIEES